MGGIEKMPQTVKTASNIFFVDSLCIIGRYLTNHVCLFCYFDSRVRVSGAQFECFDSLKQVVTAFKERPARIRFLISSTLLQLIIVTRL